MKFPAAAALEVARELCGVLKPVCERLVVAGSLRRRKAEVGDVEILFIPRFEARQVDFFKSEPMNLADEALGTLLNCGTLSKRPSKTGICSWGPKNKLALHRSNLPVDLFTATAENWWNYLVCRTGPAELNVRISSAAIARGWGWHPYGKGFSCTVTADGRTHVEWHVVTSERDVFDFVGLPYLEPEHRIK